MAVPFSVCILTRAQLGRWLCSHPLLLSAHVCQQEQEPWISSHPSSLLQFLQGKNQLPPLSWKLVSIFHVWQNTKSQHRAGTKAPSEEQLTFMPCAHISSNKSSSDKRLHKSSRASVEHSLSASPAVPKPQCVLTGQAASGSVS